MTATTTAALATVLLVGGSLPARADETRPSTHGFEVGFRTGASVPVGDTESGVPLSTDRGVQFPLWLDIGYRFGDVVVGAYGQWAPGLPGSSLREFDCTNASCLVYAWKAGFEVQIHPAGRDRAVDPWISFGFGYEWNTWKVKDSAGDGQETLMGWDFARYGLGVDFALNPRLKMGPFVHGTVSQFTNYNISWSYPNTRWFSERSVHSWITVGVKLTGLL